MQKQILFCLGVDQFGTENKGNRGYIGIGLSFAKTVSQIHAHEVKCILLNMLYFILH